MRNIVRFSAFLAFMSILSLPARAIEVDATTTVASTIANAQDSRVRIDLNTADVVTLQNALEGVGKIKAEAIVSYREANGPFASVDELLEVNGIGSSLLERNKSRLMIP